ncbi:60Kd inner membrane protein-domain-containing protein [Flagelloscypha sp. PMI_526]|nr:60Kd inner membrane protein-domain-containing protein [Flagelloscypha sp. PMI_526]
MFRFSRVPRRCVQPTLHRRTLVTELSHSFLDLASALPYPNGVPPYATTIILTTVAIRCAILPATIWSKREKRKHDAIIIPNIPRLNREAHEEAIRQLSKKGVIGDKETLKQLIIARRKRLVAQDVKTLCLKHGLHPRAAWFAPIVVQLPIFFLATWVFYDACTAGSPLEMESFATLSTLTRPDATMTLPVLYGFITMIDIESSGWRLPAENPVLATPSKDPQTQPEFKFRVQPVIKSFFRVTAIVRIVFASLAPGGVVIYWLTSSLFNCLQGWVFSWLGSRNVAAPRPRPAQSTPTKPRIQASNPVRPTPVAQITNTKNVTLGNANQKPKTSKPKKK